MLKATQMNRICAATGQGISCIKMGGNNMNEAKAMEEMKRLKGTQTEKNLAAAFAGESQAHVKYTLFARQAEKDSAMSRQIADI